MCHPFNNLTAKFATANALIMLEAARGSCGHTEFFGGGFSSDLRRRRDRSKNSFALAPPSPDDKLEID
jgi:hypothetical protein